MVDTTGSARARDPEDLPRLFLEGTACTTAGRFRPYLDSVPRWRHRRDRPPAARWLLAMDSRSAQRGQLAGSARVRVIVAPAEAATTASMPAHCAGLIC
jgi:hypothetical protein